MNGERHGETDVTLDENDRKLLERLMYGTGTVKRFTQDSPVLPDVWMAFFADPTGRIDLLLTPQRGTPTGMLAKVVRDGVRKERGEGERADVSYNQATVAVRLSFAELIRVVLPLTRWWQQHVWSPKEVTIDALKDSKQRKALAEAIANPEVKARELGVHSDLLWLLRVVGAIARRAAVKGLVYPASQKEWLKLVDGVARVVGDIEKTPPSRDVAIWNVTRNRRAELTVHRSSLAVKADAAVRLFNIKCNRLSWAIIDSGIDARHIAFQRDPEAAEAQELTDPERLKNTRIRSTYDFTVIRDLLNLDTLERDELPEHLRKALQNRTRKKQLTELIKQLRARLQRGQDVDWSILGKLIEIEHEPDQYRPPSHDHGTHVAGILAANWPGGTSEEGVAVDVRGVCPDLNLFDFRVLGADGTGDEFSIIAALQYIRHLNASRDFMVIHGANVSLSIRHDVSNYACGRTPVCDECDRLVAAGVVVVAAAGNLGYHRIQTERGFTEGYHSISITDPGNADGVVTVGSTHRQRPHTYGVSYFSSRGPTGDGRLKPDLVAPGEKILAPALNDDLALKDGTSMAAPHVSGAAALLMARHNELVGRPGMIKQILCDTATDLRRERYFQGNGMLDVLRALQSV
jgi:serine protease AprX